MEDTSVKEQILKAIRTSLIYKDEDMIADSEIDNSYDINKEDWPDVNFAEVYIKNGGGFLFCEYPENLINGIKEYFSINKDGEILCPDENISEILSVCNISHKTIPEEGTQYKYILLPCEALISNNGAIIISTTNEIEPFLVSNYTNLVTIALSSQIFPTPNEAIKNIKQRYNRELPTFIRVIQQPTSTDLTEFPNNTFLFLRYVKK